ncbi:MAG: hypothetical protein PHV56_01745 [Clostridia bacterium]|nr:hypothetical protein [Clostridia bacterium]
MKVVLQILTEFAQRTEYRVLRELYEVKPADINALQPGICLVPGIILNKAKKEQVAALVQWAKEWGNHLMLTAPWWQVKLADYLDLPTEIRIAEKKDEYKGINVAHVLITKLTPFWQSKNGDILAVSMRYNSGSGLITFTTVPLLDYKLTAKRNICKSLLDELLSREDILIPKEPLNNNAFSQELTQQHLVVLMLAAGGVDIQNELAEAVRQYVTVNITGKENGLKQDLLRAGMLDAAGMATDKGVKILVERGYRSFVRELRKQGDVDAW